MSAMHVHILASLFIQVKSHYLLYCSYMKKPLVSTIYINSPLLKLNKPIIVCTLFFYVLPSLLPPVSDLIHVCIFFSANFRPQWRLHSLVKKGVLLFFVHSFRDLAGFLDPFFSYFIYLAWSGPLFTMVILWNILQICFVQDPAWQWWANNFFFSAVLFKTRWF